MSIALYNSTNVAVTKYASCVQKATINTSKPALVWIFFLIYPGKGHERFIWLQIIGFALIIFGTLMYNEILVLPFFGLNLNTQDAIDKRQKENPENSVRLSFEFGDDIHETLFDSRKASDSTTIKLSKKNCLNITQTNDTLISSE